jgi:hypothetical protein
MGVGTSVGRIGFYGPTCEKLWCLTHIETLRQVLKALKEYNSQISFLWPLEVLDFIVYNA